MTEYQKIENELLSLGWTPENGVGDHIKFFKEGQQRPITVSRRLPGAGRALSNTYAHIRKQEPAFTLGKQAGIRNKNTPGKDKQESETPQSAPDWLRPGAPVRWTGAENRDWEKMKTPDSVMNVRYIVHCFTSNRDGVPEKVTVQDEKQNHEAFDIDFFDIDSWETVTCARCGLTIPKSSADIMDDGSFLCEDCLIKKEILKAEKKQETDKKEASPTVEMPNPLKKEADEAYKTLTRIDELISKYKDIQLGYLPTKVWSALFENVRNEMRQLPAMLVKSLKKDNPGVYEIITESKTGIASPYKAWQAVVDMLAKQSCVEAGDFNLFNTYKKEYAGAAYSVRKVKRGKQAPPVNVVEINARTWETALQVWRHSRAVLALFREGITNGTPGQEPFRICLFLNHSESKLRQYIIDPQEDDAKDLLKELMDLFKDEDPLVFQRASKDLDLVNGATVLETIGKHTNLDCFNICQTFNIREEDHEYFESAPAFHDVSLIYDDIDLEDSKDLKGLTAAIGAIGVGDIPVKLHVRLLTETSTKYTGERHDTEINLLREDFGKDNAVPETPHKEILGTEPGQTVLKIIMNARGDGFTASTPDLSDEQETRKYTESLRDILYSAMMLKNNSPFTLAIKEAADGYFSQTKENNKTTNDMPENNYLDCRNPSSDIPGAGELTTRQLLRELIDRGVTFTDLNITIKRNINIEEI